MKRIYTDFYHAFGAMENSHKGTKAPRKHFRFNGPCVFVPWWQKTLPQAKQNPRKSALSASSALLLLSLWWE